MYAAAGGASLASRQARRNVKKQHSAPDVVHQQFQKRFNQLQAQHAPASADHYQQRQHEQEQQLLARLPENCRHFELKEPFPLRHHEAEEPHLLRTAPVGVGLHSRLPSYVDLNGRITGFGSSDISEVGSSWWHDTCFFYIHLTFCSVYRLDIFFGLWIFWYHSIQITMASINNNKWLQYHDQSTSETRRLHRSRSQEYSVAP